MISRYSNLCKGMDSSTKRILTSAVESGHAEHSSLVGLLDLLLTDHQANPVHLLCAQPLVSVDSHLRPQRLGHHQHISDHRVIRPERQIQSGM